MPASNEYQPIPCSKIKVKKADGSGFHDQEIIFATDSKHVSHNNTHVAAELENIKTSIVRNSIAASPGIKESYTVIKNGDIYGIPLGKDNRWFGDLVSLPREDLNLAEGDVFSYTPAGGVQLNKSGIILVSGSIYYKASQITNSPHLGCYIHLLRNLDGSTIEALEAIAFPSNQGTNISYAKTTEYAGVRYDIPEVISSYPIFNHEGVLNSGSRILQVRAGDVLYLCGRVSDNATANVPVSSVSNQTCLNIVYLT